MGVKDTLYSIKRMVAGGGSPQPEESQVTNQYNIKVGSVAYWVVRFFFDMGITPKDTFSGVDLANYVRQMSGREVMDGTVLRQLRALRSKDIIDYDVVNARKSLYLLLKLPTSW